MLSALGVAALVLLADPGGALDRSSGCWWVPTQALEEWLGARMDRAESHDGGDLGQYCWVNLGKYRVTFIAQKPRSWTGPTNAADERQSLVELEKSGHQKFEATIFGKIVCWHASPVSPRASSNAPPNDKCVSFENGKLQLLVSSDPPGRLDLEKLKDVLVEAESRRPRP